MQKLRGTLPAPLVAVPEPLEVVDYGTALRAIMDGGFLASRKYREQQLRADREGAHPVILDFERAFVRRLAKLGVPMFASEVLRAPERQNELHKAGNSKAKAGQSPHQYGMAVDLVHGVKGWGLDPRSWKMIGHVGKELARQNGWRLTWGGDWKFYDPAHWELANWKELK
ncbi:hypothetical protein [Tortoise microvirus 78]|nr:hypothetical protein [Tortoise microvirus 78]